MSTNYHTPHEVGFRLNASEFNSVYASLDTAISNLAAGNFDTITVTNVFNHTGSQVAFFSASPSAQLTVTGNVTTGTLSDLQSVVDTLLSHLDSYGLINDSTT